jgi:hypothetical protein
LACRDAARGEPCVAVIPARVNSKQILRKNICQLGKPSGRLPLARGDQWEYLFRVVRPI